MADAMTIEENSCGTNVESLVTFLSTVGDQVAVRRKKVQELVLEMDQAMKTQDQKFQ